MPAVHTSWCFVGACLSVIGLTGGCATSPRPIAPAIEQVTPAFEPRESLTIPVIRHGRYALVELEPTAAQRDLLLQVVEVSLPQGIEVTVGDGLRHVLKRSGWRLCEGMPAIAELDALSLPAAHLSLGSLREALVTLAGAAWELRLDERTRQVCFVASVDTSDDAPDSEGSGNTVQTFPLAGEQS